MVTLRPLCLGLAALATIATAGPDPAVSAAPPSPEVPTRAAAPVRIGLVLDAHTPSVLAAADALRDALHALLDDPAAVHVERLAVVGAPLDRARAQAALSRALDHPGVDLVVAVGHGVGTLAAARTERPARPLVAPWALDPALAGRDPDAAAGAPDVHALTDPTLLSWPLDLLRELGPARSLAILAPPVIAELARGSPDRPDTAAGHPDTPATREDDPALQWVPLLADDPGAAVAGIASGTDAAIVLAGHLTGEALDQLVGALRERGLPAYALDGRLAVERGVLAGLARQDEPRRLARRAALIIQALLTGAGASELLPAVAGRAHHLVNQATAGELGLALPRSLRLEVELVAAGPDPGAETLDLAGAMREAARVRPDVLARRAAVAAGAQEVALARSSLWPQLDLDVRVRQIDRDRAEAALGSRPERAASVGGRLSQVIYSEDAHAAVGIQEQRQRARKAGLQGERLDAMAAVAAAYLDLLQARTAVRIRRDDLQLTRTQRELARMRRRVGVAGPAELPRWEGRLAQRRAELIRASARAEQAAVVVNALLDHPLETPLAPRDAVPATVLPYLDACWLRQVVDHPARFERLRDWLVQEARQRAPRLQALAAAREAGRRALTAADRAWWVPTVAVFGDLSHRVAEGGAGTRGFALDPTGIPRELRPFAAAVDDAFPPPPGRTSWSAGVSFSLPLWEGGGRRAEQLRARRDLARADHDHAAAALRLERAVRAAAHAAGASLAVIEHAEAAADAAGRTLEAVTDAYARGATDVVDLLEAQNAALAAELEAATARHRFVADYLAAERVAGAFTLLLSPERQRDRAARLRAHVDRTAE